MRQQPNLESEAAAENFERQEEKNHPDNLVQDSKVIWDFNRLKHLIPNTLQEVRDSLTKYNVAIDKKTDNAGFKFKAEIPSRYDRRIETTFVITGSGEGSIDDPESIVDDLTAYSTIKLVNKGNMSVGFSVKEGLADDFAEGLSSVEIQKYFDIERNKILFGRKINEWPAGLKYPLGGTETIEVDGGNRLLHRFFSGPDFQESWKMRGGQTISISNKYERGKSFSMNDELGDMLSKINPIYNNVIGLVNLTINDNPAPPKIFLEALQEALLWIEKQKRDGLSIEAIQ